MSNESPLVSVIIPNYNHASFLSKRIDSVLQQSYQNFEVIILDDCSIDNSREVIEHYRGHPKVSSIVYNDKNGGGPFGQWFKGIALSKGEYIWIAESDDWCEEQLLERLLQPLEADRDCHISYCQSYCVDIHGTINWQSYFEKITDIMDGESFIKNHMLLGNTIFNASMVVWRKDVFSKIRHDFIDYKYAGDKVFWIRLAQKGKVAIDGRLMNYFLKHDGDVSGNATKSGIGTVEEMRILNTMYREGLIDEKEYYKGYKKIFKNYWPLRKSIEADLRNQIDSLLESPLTTKQSYYKALFSAKWEEIRK